MRGLDWGYSDWAVIFMDATPDGTYQIQLRRDVGEPDRESIIGLNLTFDEARTPGLRDLPGAALEAVDDPPAIWIACAAPAIAAALAADNPVAAIIQLRGRRGHIAVLPSRFRRSRKMTSPRAKAARGRQDAVRQDRPEAAAQRCS